ncbi:hypothetical protein D3C80_1561710 [compost metagenome]
MQRAGKFSTDHLNYTIVVFEIIQAFPDISPMQFSTFRITDVVILFGHKYAFIARIRYRFWKPRAIYVVCSTPGEISIMSSSFNNIMLKVILMHQYQSFVICQVCKLL